MLKAIKTLRNDFVLNENFLESRDILSAHVWDILIKNEERGFPEVWTEGVTVLIEKMGQERPE